VVVEENAAEVACGRVGRLGSGTRQGPYMDVMD
jgi:hypothetical protein